ncbi:unnamed protein product [Thelazia callipaeda]|uniref:C2H2-type domain-containing protein n=1 Tax=Thelazia callipaeda TaxID=103827 RepID=A0A0N5D905_THECL|nr:unnamed protein product [Thelazia callipaeda]
MCQHCEERVKMVDHLATQSEKTLHYTRRHNKENVANENVETRVDARVRTAIRIKVDRPRYTIRSVVNFDKGIHATDTSQEGARKHLLQQSIWIPRGRSENDEHNKSKRGASTVKVSECDQAPEPVKRKLK